jgi:hypothetical protein
VKLNRFANQREYFLLRFASRDAARKIRDIRPIGTWPLFDDNKVLHTLYFSFLSPACLTAWLSMAYHPECGANWRALVLSASESTVGFAIVNGALHRHRAAVESCAGIAYDVSAPHP